LRHVIAIDTNPCIIASAAVLARHNVHQIQFENLNGRAGFFDTPYGFSEEKF
jgi:hypothetical protein